ncbi:uncharacterized protein LOC119250716 isoform X1 [Talpa occidentalis]|uniref:uncharacterized protein LOC119250716 isoform X1 n=1 Tax=Talpa occidentalis TaxID=50954 RepID=UPI0023F9923E|nr:uncharacterized protein LOC119250716 isoform X1 [Talpa occidentalis]XP_054553679.1 uncharacterized protein LOC119250716 isoform X1 [Talpa occidentalis]
MSQKPSPTRPPSDNRRSKMHRCSPLGHHPPPPRCHRSRSPVGRLSSSLHHLRVRKTSYHDNWNLLKNLASNSEQLLMQQNARITLETMFLAVLAIFSYSISPASPASLMPSVSYWAYIPDPPFLHPTPWGFPSPRVFTNYSDLLGGDSDSFVLFKSTNNFSFQGHMDSPPMCFTSNPVHMKSQLPGCLPINDKYFLTVTSKPSSSGPNRDLWVLLISLLGPCSTNENIARVSVSSTLPACSIYNSDNSQNIINTNHRFPTWHNCRFPSAGIRYQPYQLIFLFMIFQFLEQLHLPLMSPRIVGFFCRTRSSTTGQIASSHPLNLSLDGIQRDGLLPPTSSTLRMVPVHTRTYFASLPPLHLCFFADLDILFMLSPCGLVWAPLMPSSLRAPDI